MIDVDGMVGEEESFQSQQMEARLGLALCGISLTARARTLLR